MSSFIFHITFDCIDANRMAAFWSEVTGYERMDVSTDDVVALQAPDHRGVRRILFFRVPEPKTVKNRVHVDLATKDDLEDEIDRLVGMGAQRVERRSGGLGNTWTVMLDPEGNEFCIA